MAIKYVCDFCGEELSNHKNKYRFKIQEEKCYAHFDLGFVIPKYSWEEIQICDECKEKFIRLKINKNEEDISI